ncbi:cyclic nucleotide-binding domain-containing protein [Inconstantimicrobium mannanitabidum]|uniref:Catabolite gene activator protein n=1 Tax=Inconstantimicrobium mannanitabidum TaxID=1604901 RepID=A0ACB5RCE9_9CLOT|nr:cyclic nucleotide-binding domain-containing protein [Clostridium sp. TW13]GKX66718.1 catabolite gene activator protein [Clostridium sp. TW13]
MIEIIDETKLVSYIEKYSLNDMFTEDMSSYMRLWKFNKGEHICRSDENITKLYFLVSGKAKVYTILSNGKQLLLSFISPLELIGDLECIKLNQFHCNIQVIQEAYCISIDLNIIRENLMDDGRFLRYIINSLGEKLTQNTNSNSINLLYPLENRLASYILATSINDEGEETEIMQDYNLTEISELLGTSYRHLLRTLNKFIEKGAIAKKNASYEIVRRDILTDLAGDLYE